jgi:hypothetical protein
LPVAQSQQAAPAGPQTVGPCGGGDVVPLNWRVGGLLALRSAAVAVVVLLAVLDTRTPLGARDLSGFVVTYLALTSVLSAATVAAVG